MFIPHITPADIAKDSLFAGLGFSPALLFAHVDLVLLFGFLNLAVVVVFRVIELWLKYKK